MRGRLHVIADDLADDTPWIAEGIAELEAMLTKHAAFAAYLEGANR